MQKIFAELGFYVLCEVKKQRKTYLLGDLIVTLDDVEDLGEFIELEGKASNDAEYKEKKKDIFMLLNELELSSEKISKRSYLEMLIDEKRLNDT